jgi:hypothetical protein
MITQREYDFWLTSLLAVRLGTYPVFRIASRTRWRVETETFGSLFTTRETVFIEQPASLATTRMVADMVYKIDYIQEEDKIQNRALVQ